MLANAGVTGGKTKKRGKGDKKGDQKKTDEDPKKAGILVVFQKNPTYPNNTNHVIAAGPSGDTFRSCPGFASEGAKGCQQLPESRQQLIKQIKSPHSFTHIIPSFFLSFILSVMYEDLKLEKNINCFVALARRLPLTSLTPLHLFAYLRDHAFKLRPIGMSGDLIQQLKACSLKLGTCAETLQQKIKEKCNKNRHYVNVIEEVSC